MIKVYDLTIYKWAKKIWYKVLIALSKKNGVRYTVNRFKFRMPVSCFKYNKFRIFPRDYEKENFEFFRRVASKGITCLDIGAHIGLYSVFMNKHADAKVFSFEPTPTSQEVFRDMQKVNKCGDLVTLIPAAVSDKSGKASFYITETPLWVGNSLLKENIASDKLRCLEVDVYSIDEFVEKNNIAVHFIKIDAEGMELEVVKGAKNVFLKYKPSGILGIHPSTFKDKKGTYEKIWETLNGYGMQLFFENQILSQERFMTELLDKKNPFDLQFLKVN